MATHSSRSQVMEEMILNFRKDRILARGNMPFQMTDIYEHVRAKMEIAPETATRILRMMRQNGLLDYRKVAKSQHQFV